MKFDHLCMPARYDRPDYINTHTKPPQFSSTGSTGIALSNILGGGGNQNIVGQNVVRTDESMGVSQLLGGTCPGCPPKSTSMIGRSDRNMASQNLMWICSRILQAVNCTWRCIYTGQQFYLGSEFNNRYQLIA